MSSGGADRSIYFDHNATTPLRSEVRAAMLEALAEWGNPSSVHALGRRARAIIERARGDVAGLVGATPEDIVFTSGGTEGDNLAVRGLALAARQAKRSGAGAHVVSSGLEHPAVRGALAELRREGFELQDLPVGPHGQLDPADLDRALRDETVLVTLQLANHEIGNVYPLAALAAAAHSRGALIHTDAVQAVGRVPVDVMSLGVDAATLSAHKLGGPKGVGAVFVRRGVTMHGLVAGGHQERERRGGTENVAGIAGFGAACRVARAELAQAGVAVAKLRDRLEGRLLAISGARLHGFPPSRVPGTTNVAFAGAGGELVMIGLDLEGVCVSTGAACTSGSLEPSPVLLAMGLPAASAREAVRFSLGPENTEAEVDGAVELVQKVVARVRAAGSDSRGRT